MGSEISEEEMAELRETFKLFDTDDSGTITSKELGCVMRSMGLCPTEAELMEMIKEVDNNGDGTIDFDEFLGIVSKANETDETTMEAFNVFDKDRDGFINRDELKQVMKNLGQECDDASVDEMIREADVDGDGKIDYKEFARMMAPK